MKKFLLLALIVLNSAFASVTDVTGPNTAIIVEKDSSGKDCVKFFLQAKGKLSPLGHGKCFSERNLKSIKNKEQWQFAGTLLADATVATLGFAAGLLGGSAAALFLSATPLASTAAGNLIWLTTPLTTVVVGSSSVYFASKLRPLDPFAQYKDIHVLNDKIISDINIAVETDEEVMELAHTLDLVLKK
jgi:hypothetical protein